MEKIKSTVEKGNVSMQLNAVYSDDADDIGGNGSDADESLRRSSLIKLSTMGAFKVLMCLYLTEEVFVRVVEE